MAERDVATNAANPIRLIARHRPLSSDRLETSFPPGMSLAAMLNECGLDPDVVPARVCIDDRVIEAAFWEQVKPQAGQLVTVRVIPQGGGGQSKDILRIVAMVGVLVLAIAAPWLAGLAGATLLSAGIGGALLTGAVSLGGSLRILDILPQKPSARVLEIR